MTDVSGNAGEDTSPVVGLSDDATSLVNRHRNNRPLVCVRKRWVDVCLSTVHVLARIRACMRLCTVHSSCDIPFKCHSLSCMAFQESMASIIQNHF